MSRRNSRSRRGSESNTHESSSHSSIVQESNSSLAEVPPGSSADSTHDAEGPDDKVLSIAPTTMVLAKEPVVFSGLLNKWTNYASGYRRRYFHLTNGILSYYKNLSEYPNRSRGSMLVKDTKIYLNSTDKLRFDVISVMKSGSVRYHLKADSIDDLNNWVLAFHQAKNFELTSASSRTSFSTGRVPDITVTRSPVKNATLFTIPQHSQASPRSEQSSSSDTFSPSDTDSFDMPDPLPNIHHHREFLDRTLTMRKDIQNNLLTFAQTTEDMPRLDSMEQPGLASKRRTKHISNVQSIVMFELLKSLYDFMGDVEGRESYWHKHMTRHIVKVKALEANLRSAAISQTRVERQLNEERHRQEKIVEQITSKLSPDQMTGLADEIKDLIERSSITEDEDDEFFDALESVEQHKLKQLSAAVYERVGSPEKVLQADAASLRTIEKSVEPVSHVTSAPSIRKFLENSTEGYPSPPRSLLDTDAVVDAASVSVWTVLKHAIGKDMSRISIPIHYNEPLSMLQRMAEDMEYSLLLDKAAAEKNPLVRIQYIAAFAASNYSSTESRISKPFNPLLHETFELVCVENPVDGDPLVTSADRPLGEGGFRYVSEQVCHHPPISACYAEAPRWIYWSEVNVRTNFWGKSMEIVPSGVSHVSMNDEHYSWKKVTTVVNNIIMGKLWIDHYGEMVITNHTTGERCTLEFKQTTWRGNNAKKIEGRVENKRGELIYEIQGKWTEGLTSTLVRTDLDLPRSVDMWKVRPRPSKSPAMYNYTRFAMALNELPSALRECLPSTDSRLRPDQRAMEDGDLDAGVKLKDKLELKQRDRRNLAKTHNLHQEGVVDLEGDGKPPRWFVREIEEDTNESHWVFKGSYWESRSSKQWRDVPVIFDIQ